MPIMSIFILYNNPKFNIEIILILILSIVIYFTSLFILKAFNESEINFVKNFYKNKKQ